jgi:hypothetical protein
MFFRQVARMSNADYPKKFKGHLDVLQYLGGDVGVVLAPLIEYTNALVDPDNPTKDEIRQARAQAKDEYLGIRFLQHSDPIRYGALLAEVENSHTRGIDPHLVVADQIQVLVHESQMPSLTK